MQLSQLSLKRPLVVFDLETTGVNVVTDRIVQFAGLRYEVGGGEPVELNLYVNPTVPIPAETTAIHGITDARVVDEPTFAELAEQIFAFVDDADLAGYNLGRFDVPLLMEEFARVGKRFRSDNRSIVDAQEIFYKMEPRTLAGAMRYYCNEQLEDAHDALADVVATARVLEGQLAMYAGQTYTAADGKATPNAVRPDVEALHAFAHRPGQLDATNRLRADKTGEPVFNFGKHRNRRVRDVFKKEPSYYRWLQDKDFSVQVKEITQQVWDDMQGN